MKSKVPMQRRTMCGGERLGKAAAEIMALHKIEKY